MKYVLLLPLVLMQLSLCVYAADKTPLESYEEKKLVTIDGVEGYWHYNYRHSKNPQKGGFVERSAYVADTVFLGPDAKVLNSASVEGSARVYGNAVVAGEAIVKDKARVFGNAHIKGNAEIRDVAQVSGEAQVSGDAIVAKSAKVRGYSVLEQGEHTEGVLSAPKPEDYDKDSKTATKEVSIKDTAEFIVKFAYLWEDKSTWGKMGVYDKQSVHNPTDPYVLRRVKMKLSPYSLEKVEYNLHKGIPGDISFQARTVGENAKYIIILDNCTYIKTVKDQQVEKQSDDYRLELVFSKKDSALKIQRALVHLIKSVNPSKLEGNDLFDE